MAAAILFNTALRSSWDFDDHSGNAFLAAATALSTSTSPALGTSPNGSFVAGFTVVSVFPEAALTHSPAMSIFFLIIFPSLESN